MFSIIHGILLFNMHAIVCKVSNLWTEEVKEAEMMDFPLCTSKKQSRAH